LRPFRTGAIGALLLVCATAVSAQSSDPLSGVASRYHAGSPATPNVFGTAALNAGVTLYDVRFRRVSSSDRTHPEIRQMADTVRYMNSTEKLATVQRLVNERVAFATDLDALGVSDYWSSAGETLKRGRGDAEDLAIVKMQVLRAAGVSPRDMYISVGRDTRSGAHELLLVRLGGQFYALDQQGGVKSAAERGTFTPIFTMGQGASFLHGRRIARIASTSARLSR
jgi:predicted transglutaminase-like cysteine proteinase